MPNAAATDANGMRGIFWEDITGSAVNGRGRGAAESLYDLPGP